VEDADYDENYAADAIRDRLASKKVTWIAFAKTLRLKLTEGEECEQKFLQCDA